MIDFVNNSSPDLDAENLNKMQQDIGTVVSATEPQGNNRLKVWLQNVDGKEKIYVLNSNNIYEEFIKNETIKIGTFANPDEESFKITRSRIIQVGNTIYGDIAVKILKQISANKQYNFAISGVNTPKLPTYVFGSYGSNEYTHTNTLYVYVYEGSCFISNISAISAVNGYWKAHFSYNID